MNHPDRGEWIGLVESGALQTALVLAIRSLALTHRVDEHVRALLAECLRSTIEARCVAAPEGSDAIFALAAHGVETFLGLYNRERALDARIVH